MRGQAGFWDIGYLPQGGVRLITDIEHDDTSPFQADWQQSGGP